MNNIKLDRWIALAILIICSVYAYTAFFTMDNTLPPFMQRNPIWPSTFPKILSILAIIFALVIVLGIEKDHTEIKETEINYKQIFEYKIGQVISLITLMAIYALILRPIGFILATNGFLIISAIVLGERKWQFLIPIAIISTLARMVHRR